MPPSILTPASIAELRSLIAEAAGTGQKLEIRGGGSKAGTGAPDREADILSMCRFSGIIDYDPAELVLDVQAATPLSAIQAAIAAQNQMLAFEPFDHGSIFGEPEGRATIGGIIAASVAGSSRLTAGAARDHFLGFEAVSGRAEIFTAGAKVVKNVTGYDLPKILAGSWGRLAAMTRVTLKVLPFPRTRVTLALHGLSPRQALAAMALAMRSQAEVTAAAHLPAAVNNGASLTALRLQGFGPSVAARCAMLEALLRETGSAHSLGETEANAFWQSVRDTRPLDAELPLWRINVPPSASVGLAAQLEPLGLRWFFDWAGGLIWANFVGEPAKLRAAAAAAGGHAILVRGPAQLRAATPAQHPESPAVTVLAARIRHSFDPRGVFEAGRFLDVPPEKSHAN
jgi:glycolate oxidase FAD binding subunit